MVEEVASRDAGLFVLENLGKRATRNTAGSWEGKDNENVLKDLDPFWDEL